MNADGTSRTRLTENDVWDGSPSWSPDGSRIAFQHSEYLSSRDGNSQIYVSQIYVMNADGTGQTNLTNTDTHDIAPSWSPDGSRIAFHSLADGSGGGQAWC